MPAFHRRLFSAATWAGAALILDLLAVAVPSVAMAADVMLTPQQNAINGFWRGGAAARPQAAPGGAGPPGAPPGQRAPRDAVADAAASRLLPWAATFHTAYQAAEAAGEQQRTPNNLCIPSIVPGTGVRGGGAYSFGILIEPKLVALLYEENRTIRLVHMDQPHPAKLEKSWLGHSVGRWEGDELIVDTVGFNSDNMLVDGIPVSDRLHVIQRMRVVNGVLEDTVTFEDPGTFSAPFTVTNRMGRTGPFQEYICAENNNQGGIPTLTSAPTLSPLARAP